MNTNKSHSEKEIRRILQELEESGGNATIICLKYNVSRTTLFRWKAKYLPQQESSAPSAQPATSAPTPAAAKNVPGKRPLWRKLVGVIGLLLLVAALSVNHCAPIHQLINLTGAFPAFLILIIALIPFSSLLLNQFFPNYLSFYLRKTQESNTLIIMIFITVSFIIDLVLILVANFFCFLLNVLRVYLR
jgi:hypothetical protein